MSGLELFEKIAQSNKYDSEETILDANELIEVLNPRHSFTESFKAALNVFAEQNNRCEYCGQELELKSFKESIEYMGSPGYEEVNMYLCDNPDCSNSY